MGSIASFGSVLKKQVQQGGVGLEDYWSDGEIASACRDEGYAWRERFWTPLRTIATFLLQVLHAGSSCREAVVLALGAEAAGGSSALPSADPSAYCQARKRLPLGVLRAGARRIGERLRDEVASTLSWCGRRVWVVDGTSCSMSDTPELQEVFTQPTGQAEGCGFPVATVVALFCWASGAVVEAAIGPWWMSELALWRTLWTRLSPGEVVLADRFYCTFYDIVGVMRRGLPTASATTGGFPQGTSTGTQRSPGELGASDVEFASPRDESTGVGGAAEDADAAAHPFRR